MNSDDIPKDKVYIKKEYDMKKFRITLFLLITIIFIQTFNVVYAAEETTKAEQSIEKYNLLKEENIKLRNDILKIKNQLSKKKAKKIPVLMYHHLLPQKYINKYNWSTNSSVLSVEAFKKQMDYLHKNGFYVATLDELQAFKCGEISLPEKTVVITFDDGYLSNAIYAYPILKKYNFRATIFMLGYRVDNIQKTFDPSTLQSLSIDEAYKYIDVFDYESHTYALHNLDSKKVASLLSSDKKTILDDLTKNKELLNAKYFAYPYGKYNKKTIQYVKQTGHEMAFTVKKGYVTKNSNKYELPRFGISPKGISFNKFVEIVNGKYKSK